MDREYEVLTVAAIFLLLGAIVLCAQGASSALSLGDGGDYVEVTDNDSLDITDKITLEAWANPDAVGDDFHTIVAKGGNVGNGGAYHMSIANIGVWRLLVNDGVWHCVDADTKPEAQKWTHVAMTYDVKAQTVKIYLNGKLDKSDTGFNFTPLVDEKPLHLGANNAAQFWVGLLDEIRIWNIIRTEAEIKRTMDKYLYGDEKGLVGYWTFDENASDMSPNGNDGELQGEAKLISPGKDLKPAMVDFVGKLTATWGQIKCALE